METLLFEVQKFPQEWIKNSMRPIIKVLIAKELSRHSDLDVNILVVCYNKYNVEDMKHIKLLISFC